MLYLCYFFIYFKVLCINLGEKIELKWMFDVVISVIMYFFWINLKYDV